MHFIYLLHIYRKLAHLGVEPLVYIPSLLCFGNYNNTFVNAWNPFLKSQVWTETAQLEMPFKKLAVLPEFATLIAKRAVNQLSMKNAVARAKLLDTLLHFTGDHLII